MNTRSFILSILIAGLITGVLGNLPVLNLINCFLCIFVWFGGFLAVIFYNRFQRGGPVATPGLGAGLGALTGLVGAVIGVVVYAITSSLSIPLFASLARFLQVEGDFPAMGLGIREMLVTAFIFLILDLILYPIFGALGGLITASIIKEPAAYPPAQTPL